MDILERERNWAGNYEYRARRIHTPETLEQVQDLVARSTKLKALGTRHSFNDIADSSHDLISLEQLDQIVSLDRERKAVTVEGGIKYGALCRYLANEGFTLQNLASLPHISVAGACATATHGSGDKNRNLAAAVTEMEMVIASGEVVVLTREKDGEQFNGAVVHLGALGIVTKLTLDIVPAFEIRQYVYEDLPLGRLKEHFYELVSSAYSVSMFTDWRRSMINQLWIKSRDDGFESAAQTLYGATLATEPLHPIKGISAENCTAQMGICGPAHERLPHFRMEYTPSSGEELQSEYFVPREHAFAALSVIDGLREHIAPVLQISEVRTIAADDLWMSPCYKQSCVALHFTWKKDWTAVSKVLPMIEAGLMPFGVRPHWGKLFAMQHANLTKTYKKLSDFRDLILGQDPDGKFRNEFTERYILGAVH